MKFAFYSNLLAGLICTALQVFIANLYLDDDHVWSSDFWTIVWQVLFAVLFAAMACILFVSAYKIHRQIKRDQSV